MADLMIVVLAAGEGTRMKSELPKILHPLAGRPMIAWVLAAAESLGRKARRVAVLGRGHREVSVLLEGRGWNWVLQKERLGTGHALRTALPLLRGHRGDVLVLSGDTPLLTPGTLRNLLRAHRGARAAMTLLTAVPADPKGYGRVQRDDRGRIAAIVEQKELSRDSSSKEINAGVYVFRADFLRRNLPRLEKHRAAGEYYLTDLAAAAAADGTPAFAAELADPEEAAGINDRRQLAQAEAVLRRRILDRLMIGGVTITDPAATYVGAEVRVGGDTVLFPGTILEGKTRVGKHCRLGPWVRLRDSRLGVGVEVRDGSVVEDSVVRAGAVIGPMARLRPGTTVGAGARVGNFVEIKQSTLGDGAKASHLTYLGDAVVGAGANIGAGTITCNYDGERKHRTVIGAGAFIGSDTMLVAPVKVGRRAVIGAGSVITRDVPDEALGLARAPQANRENWVRFRQALGRRKK